MEDSTAEDSTAEDSTAEDSTVEDSTAEIFQNGYSTADLAKCRLYGKCLVRKILVAICL